MVRLRNTIEQALWAKVAVTGFCWLYEGYIDAHGYGYTTYNRKGCRVHRLAYEVLVGDIPKGLVIDHLCRVRNCVNPDHLETVTHKQNLLRGFTAARTNKAKMHCVKGHAFTPENTYQSATQRYCRQCQRDKQQRLNSPERRRYRAAKAREYRARDKCFAQNRELDTRA